MRTTLTLDDDLAGLLKRRAQELGIPFKEAVKLGQLADELEAEAFADKLDDSARRKHPRSRA